MKQVNKRMQSYLSKLIVFVVLGMSSKLAFALFNGPISSTVQGSGLIKDKQVNTLRITWRGESNSTISNNIGQPYQVFSNNGVFEVNQTVVGNSNRRISKTLITGGVNAQPFSISETLRIPRSVLAAAERAGSNRIRYVRTFTDESGGGRDLTSSLTLQVTPSSGGALSISQIDLRFQNGGISMVTGTNQIANATAIISYSGSGLLDLAWEVATPASTSGTPVFTTLKTVRQFLGAGRSSVIESPRLPTLLTGSYMLRLRINSPKGSFENLVLRYSVIRSGTPAKAAKPINLISPLPNAVIDQSTQFIWKPITNAISYQLEIYELPATDLPYKGLGSVGFENNHNKVLTTGVLIPSDRQTTPLTPIALQYLIPDKTYYWRTIAVDGQGNLVGKSGYQKIIFTQKK